MSYMIENITSKEVNTKFGPKPAFSIKTSEGWFSYGFKKPAFAIGDEVDFQYTENTYGKNVDHASVQMITKGTATAAAAPAAAAPRSGGYPAKVFPIPALHGDRAIIRQNSVTNATKIVTESEHIDEAPEGMALEVIRIARILESYSCGDIDAEMAESMATVKAD
jgi:hypothetical protein